MRSVSSAHAAMLAIVLLLLAVVTGSWAAPRPRRAPAPQPTQAGRPDVAAGFEDEPSLDAANRPQPPLPTPNYDQPGSAPPPVPGSTSAPQNTDAPAPSPSPTGKKPWVHVQPPRTDEYFVEYDGLTSGLGDWKGFGFTHHERFESGSWFAGFESLDRSTEGTSVFVAGGVTKDWTDSFYTVTAIGGSTNSEWYPKFRVDQDFNFKVGNKKNIVLVLGFTDIWYHESPRQDQIFSLGTVIYMGEMNFEYRHFFNNSLPGSVGSGSDIVNLGYLREGDMAIDLTYGWGNQAYLPSLVLPLAEVRNSDVWRLKFKKWTTKNGGFFIVGQHAVVTPGYTLNGFQTGWFTDY